MISNKHLHIHFKAVNGTLFFVLFLIIISNLPHDTQPIVSWVNCSIYFLVFLQSWFLFRQTKQNKSIFFNIMLFALLHSLSFVYPYAGQWFQNPNTTWLFFVYFYLLQTFFFALSSIFIATKYYFYKDDPAIKDSTVYAISLGIMLAVFIWFFYPYLIHPAETFKLSSAHIDKLILKIDFLPLFFILFFGFLLYKYDHSLGEFINAIMVCFFIMTIMDITNLVGEIYEIMIFSFTQYILLLTLTFFVLTSFRLINHIYSAFGQFYDALTRDASSFAGIPIKRKKTVSLSFLDFAKAYFHQRRNSISFFTLLFILCINFLNISLFVKINLAVLIFGALVLFYYLSALYQKRSKDGYLLNLKRTITKTL